MRYLRLFVKLPFFALYIGAMDLIRRIGGLFARSAPKRAAWQQACFRTFCRGTLRILGVRMVVEGVRPEPPFLLISNHLGYLDVPVLGSLSGGRFVAKREVASWPWLGSIVAGAGTLFVDRARHRDLLRANQIIAESIQSGDGIILFPEGTSSSGATVLPFRPSLLQVPADQAIPVHYASITYRTPPGCPPASEAVCWWGGRPFADHVPRLFMLPHIECRVRVGPQPVSGSNRKDLAQRLHDAVLDQFIPSTPPV